MLQNQSKESSHQTLYMMLGLGLLIYIVLSILAGMPAAANLTAFVIGLAVLFIIILALAAFTWVLLFKPLPAGFKVDALSPLSHAQRQGIAFFLVISSLLGMVGGIWDIAWHTTYGLPFGIDFFWRPHQFIYVALFAPILVAAYIWFQTLRQGKGTLQQRFRADMPMSIIMLGGLYMLAIVPMDPVWHQIYAEDLSGLSVPHLLFSLPNILLTIGFLSIWLSYAPIRSEWQAVWKANKTDLLIAFVAGNLIVTLLFAAIGDWEMISANLDVIPRLPMMVASRPEWALIATLSFCVLFGNSIVSRSTKLIGSATLSLIIAAIVRQTLFTILNNGFQSPGTWLVVLPFALSVDFLAWYSVKRAKEIPVWQKAGFTTLMGAIFALPQMNFFYTLPVVSLSNAPVMILTIFFTSFAAIWMGSVIGDTIASVKRQEAIATEAPRVLPNVLKAGAAVAIVLLLFAVWFITSSTAPI